MSTALLPSVYLGPVQYYSKLRQFDVLVIEQHEHFPKQTYRNRAEIYSPNGLLSLSVPLVKRNMRQAMKDVRIAYDYDWQKLHWRSLESSYRRSPFFEYYEDDFRPFYEGKQFEFLIDLNEALEARILKLLKWEVKFSKSTTYEKTLSPEQTDFRELISPKNTLASDPDFVPKIYYQVFETRHGFLPNLSIVDLLFNEGSKATNFI